MRATTTVVGLVFALAPALTPLACAETQQPSSPSISSFSQPSSSFEPSYRSQPSAPGVVRVDADLVVRPDLVCVPFSVTADDVDALAALLAAQQQVALLGAAGTVRVDDIATELAPSKKSEHRNSGHARGRVVVRGVVEAALPDGDAFARGAVVARVTSALWSFSHPAEADEQARRKGVGADDEIQVVVAVGAAEPGLRDTEQHRQKLLDGWAARVSAMQQSIGGGGIELTGCQAPPAVRITGGTMERVGLQLPISCTIAIQPKKA